MSVLGVCLVCGQEIDSLQSYAVRVSGWEAKRSSGGGANRIIDRVRLGDAIAHTMCVEQRAARRRRGIADDQQELS